MFLCCSHFLLPPAKFHTTVHAITRTARNYEIEQRVEDAGIITSFITPPSTTAFSTFTVTCGAVSPPSPAGTASLGSSGSKSLRMMNHVFTLGVATATTPATRMIHNNNRHYWTENEGQSISCNKNAMHAEWACIISKVSGSEQISRRPRRMESYELKEECHKPAI